MPVYEYRCKRCQKTFEVLQKISSEPLRTCLECGGPLEKLISVSSFQFKGSGWYITDYKNRSNGNGKEKKASGNGTNKKEETKTKDVV